MSVGPLVMRVADNGMRCTFPAFCDYRGAARAEWCRMSLGVPRALIPDHYGDCGVLCFEIKLLAVGSSSLPGFGKAS